MGNITVIPDAYVGPFNHGIPLFCFLHGAVQQRKLVIKCSATEICKKTFPPIRAVSLQAFSPERCCLTSYCTPVKVPPKCDMLYADDDNRALCIKVKEPLLSTN